MTLIKKKFLMKILWEASGTFILVSALVQDLIKVFLWDQHGGRRLAWAEREVELDTGPRPTL